MGVEENIKVVRGQVEAVNARDWDNVLGAYAESIVLNTPASQEPIKGVEGVKQYMAPFFDAFGDLQVKEVHSFGQGDWVVVESEFGGTHTGTLVNPDGSEIPATNKTIKIRGADVMKVEDGKITEQRSYFDQLGFMAQLGLMPENE